MEVGSHSAHRVVRGRTDRDHVGRNVDVVLQASGVNARESRLQVRRIQVREIEVDNRLLGGADTQFVNDGPGHDIARRQFAEGMVLRHEAQHLIIAQICAFAAQSFRKQESRSFLQIQRRGMKLDEFHVTDLCARAERHGHAVGRRYPGIGGVAVELPDPSGGQ